MPFNSFNISRKRVSQISYMPIRPRQDLFVKLVYSSNQDSCGYDMSLKELLEGAQCRDAASMFVFGVEERGLFVLWISPSEALSTNSLDDALAQSTAYIERSVDKQTCTSFYTETSKTGTLAVFVKCDEGLARSMGLPPAVLEKIAASDLARKTRHHPRNFLTGVPAEHWRLWVLFVIACILVAIFCWRPFLADSSPDELHTWMAYDTQGSVGPKYQLSVNGANASNLVSYMEQHGEWTLRIDDQAIIPLSLLDEDEKHYQQWYQNRYPETNAIMNSGNYLNETWLNSPLAERVPADDMFHFSHCVLAVKRYVKAKQTGRHVCGRDIDEEHVQHCLDALDWWAFPESGGKRGDTVPNPTKELAWRTKVCFD